MVLLQPAFHQIYIVIHNVFADWCVLFSPWSDGLFVAAPINSPHFMTLKEGDPVEILDVLSDNESVIIRTQDGSIGYFRLDYLATESEVC